jgi:hypothetical protein
MNLKEKIKKWKRNWYELSVDELKKKQKKCKTMGLISYLLLILFLFYAVYGMQTLSSGTITVLTIMGMMFIVQLGLLFSIIFIVLALDYYRDASDLNILIYLKQNKEK